MKGVSLSQKDEYWLKCTHAHTDNAKSRVAFASKRRLALTLTLSLPIKTRLKVLKVAKEVS